jgi:cyanophycinase
MTATRTFLLLGSGEFEPWSEEVERAALEGRPQVVAIVPAASAPEGDHVFDRWATMGLEHYAAMDVEARVVSLKDRSDADRDEVVSALEGAGMVFFSGGNPRFLADTLRGSRFLAAVLEGMERGLVYAGCSAGAMVASRTPQTHPRVGAAWVSGLGLIPDGVFGVHWDRMRFIPGMRSFVRSRNKGSWFAGIDERTAILGDGERWTVFGKGTVSLRTDSGHGPFRAGSTFTTSPKAAGRAD